MAVLDIIFLVFAGMTCFYAGRASMLYSITKTNLENIDIQEIGNLFIEKINNTYYAYVEDKFVGQSNDLDELFQNMKNVHNIKTFNIDKINGLTQDEYNLVIQAIEKCYTVV